MHVRRHHDRPPLATSFIQGNSVPVLIRTPPVKHRLKMRAFAIIVLQDENGVWRANTLGVTSEPRIYAGPAIQNLLCKLEPLGEAYIDSRDWRNPAGP